MEIQSLQVVENPFFFPLDRDCVDELQKGRQYTRQLGKYE